MYWYVNLSATKRKERKFAILERIELVGPVKIQLNMLENKMEN